MTQYLDELEHVAQACLPRTACSAALGPSLALAASRTRGTHTYLVTPEHRAQVRATGTGPLIAAERKARRVRDRPRAGRARDPPGEPGRLPEMLPNYTNNFLRLGFTEDDSPRRR